MTEDNSIKIIPLGGANEIGKNMVVIEYNDHILVIDSGLMFPDSEMLGVDIVIPDISYLVENRDRIQGIILTHGHEDHIGALPYVLRQINVPLWGSRLTLGILRPKLEEHGLYNSVELHEVEIGDRFNIGIFDIDTIRVSHSIPDGFGMAIRLPAGTIVHTGDFKFDHTPVDGKVTDFAKLARIGGEGVSVLIMDITNVEKSGYVPSEAIVGEMFEKVFRNATGKIIVAAFASNINRIQQVFNVAAGFGRKVAVVGRSMAQNVEIAEELGYLNIPPNTKISIDEISELYPAQVVVMTTGSQGEPLSALTRIAMDEHKKVKIDKGDTVIISATAIPGNEDLVSRTINRLFKRGAEVIYDPIERVHVSGHGNREDLKLMQNLIMPRYIVPYHGEPRHVAKYIEMANEMGYSSDRIFSLELGDVLEVTPCSAGIIGSVQAGSVLVDGIGIGDVGNIVLRDRRHLAADGIFIIVITVDRATGQIAAGPDIVSRGFIYMDEAEDFVEEVRQLVLSVMESIDPEEIAEWAGVKADIKSAVARFLYSRTHRRPIVIPVIMEI